ncbi:MAG TPA: GNAT family N-acetyltransferase [Kineosporiaceae bacterium]
MTPGVTSANRRWRIRTARPDDVPALHALIRELATYEREPDAVEATEADLRQALFADRPLVHALVAALDPARATDIAGMALWFVSYSTWRGRHGVWLEDLFVRPQARGLGLGRALLQELAAEAVHRGYARLEWNVLDWNEPALGFYARLGARPLDDWTVHRLDDRALHELASARRQDPA